MASAGEIVKKVRTVFTVENLTALEKKMTRMGAVATKVHRSISGMVSPLAGMVTIGAGIGLAKHLADVGRAAEDSELRMASLIKSAANMDFRTARSSARALRDEFERLAIDSPATAEQIEASFADMTFGLSGAGITLREQAMIARDVATRGQLEGLDKGVMARDVRQILSGSVSLAEISAASLRPVAQEAAKLAKAGKAAQAVELVRKALALTDEELAAQGASTSGRLATVQDQLVKLKRTAAEPLMTYFNAQLKRASDWLSKNEKEAKAIARAIGDGITGAVRTVVRLTETLARHWGIVETTVKTLFGVWLGSRAFAAMTTLIGQARQFATFMAAAGQWVNTKGGWKGVAGKAGKVAGVAGILGAVYGIADAVADTIVPEDDPRWGKGGAQAFSSKAEFDAWVQSQRSDRMGAVAGLDGVVNGNPFKVGSMGVGKMQVDKMEVRERDFARLASGAVARARADSRSRRPLSGLGLGLAGA